MWGEGEGEAEGHLLGLLVQYGVLDEHAVVLALDDTWQGQGQRSGSGSGLRSGLGSGSESELRSGLRSGSGAGAESGLGSGLRVRIRVRITHAPRPLVLSRAEREGQRRESRVHLAEEGARGLHLEAILLLEVTLEDGRPVYEFDVFQQIKLLPLQLQKK